MDITEDKLDANIY